jgi:hypothetical protein
MASEDAILMGSFRDPNARSVEPATFDSSIDEVQAEEPLDDLRSRYDELLESSPVVEAEPEESESGFTNQLLGSLERTVAVDNPRLGGRAIEGLGRVTGIESMQEFGEKIVREFDQSDNPDEFVPRVSSYKDWDGLQSFLDYAGSTLGQGLGSLGVVVGGGAAGAAAGSVIPGAGTAAGALVGATGSGFLLNYGDTYEYLVEQEGMDPNDAAPYALIPAAGMAVLDTAGVGLVLKPVKDKLKKDLVKRTAQLALRGAGSESLTETAQQVIQESAGEMAEALGLAKNDIVASQRYENIANAFFGSLLPGAVFGGASAPFQRPVDKPDVTPPSKPEPDEFGLLPYSLQEDFLTDDNIDQIKNIVRPGYAYFTNSVGSSTQATRAKRLGGVNVIGQGIAESGLLFNERNKGLRIRPFMHPLGAMEDADGTSVVERLKEAVERGNYLRNAPLTFVYELPIGDVPFQSKVVDGTTIYDGRDDVILNAAKVLGLPGTELATAAADSIKQKRGVSRSRDLNRVMPPEFIKGVFVNGQLMTLDDYKASLGLDIDKGSAVEVSAAVAQSEENAPEAAPLPVVESEPVRVTAALTGVQDARDDMKKLKNQFLEESRAIVEAEKRGDNVEPLRKAVKTIENKIFADFEAGLRSLLERDGDIEIVSFERGLGGWAGQELEPNLRIEVSGDKDTVLSRITEFNQTSGMSGPNAVPQGGALNRILVETIQDKPDVIDLYDAANIEENKKLVWDDNGAERLATLQIDLPAEMLTPESLASLGSVFAKRSLGFTVDRKNNRIELIHTPEWSRTNAQDTLSAFVEASKQLRKIAIENFQSEVSFRWIKEQIEISAPESDVINIKNSFSDGDSAYRVVGYTELRKNVEQESERRDSGDIRGKPGDEGGSVRPDAGDSGRPDAGESGVNVEALDDATRGAAAGNRELSKLSTYGQFVLRGIGREESIGLDRLHAGAEQKGSKVDADASRALMAHIGLEFSDSDTSAGLKIYPLQDKFGTTLEEVIDRLNKWTKSKGTVAEGWTFSVFGPKRNEDGTLGDFVPPDFKNNSYDQKNAYIYQPYDPNGSFDDVAYTYAWRATHEIAHGIVNDKLTEQYGGTGRRAGGLGIFARDDSGKNIVEPLVLAHALRALDWEHETFLKQREILEQDFGITITDEQFKKEYLLNMADAVHRVLTGRFSNPGKLGAVPVSMDPAVVLERAKQTVRDATAAMGMDMAESLGDAAKSNPLQYFSGAAFEKARKATNPVGSRETLIYMDIANFLYLVPDEKRQDSVENVKNLIDEGTKFESLPYLQIDESGKVVGHEGRHRARALKERGVNRIPVVIESDNIRWQKQADDSPDRVDFPQFLMGEDGQKIPFPFQSEGPNRGKPLPESSADAATPVAEPDPLLEQRIEEAAEAGSKTKKEAREAARLWKEKGILSKYFKRWFGKSVLVDSKGKPVRLFHGTDRVFSIFAEPEGPGLFGQGIYATFLPYIADEYTSKLSSTDKDPSLQPNIIPGYVSIQNPIFTREPVDAALIEEAKKVAASFSRKLYLPKGDLTTFDDLLLALDDVTPDRRRYVAAQRKLRLKMVKLGYDGMINASKASFEKAQQIDFKSNTIFDDIPRDMHIILMDSSQFKSDIGNLGTFDPLDPRIQYGLTGAAIPAAAALQESDEDEGEGEGNPVAEDFEGPFIYNETRDYSGVSEMVNTMRDAQARYEDLLSEINIIEAEYTSLTQEDRDGDRGRLLSEWHDKTLDEYSSVGDFIDESAYTRFLMGSDVYFDTQPTDIRGFDERRGFRQVGLTDEPMTMDISTRRKQENEQRFKLQNTVENGGPYVDFFGELGDLNKYLYKKASFFEEPVQTVQLNGHEKRMLYSDEVNLKRLYDSGLVSYLLYRELVGDVELL